MLSARQRFLQLLSCIQCGSIENAPTPVTEFDRYMLAVALDDDTYDDEQLCYVVGSKPYNADWLSLKQGGEALVPQKGVLYIVESTGIYKNKVYRWNGSNYILLGDGAGGQTLAVEITADDHVTLSVKNQLGQDITTSANFGDTLTITATPDADYTLDSLTVNGEPFESGGTVMVTEALSISATSAEAQESDDAQESDGAQESE